jgi:hypothetical protein
MSSRVNLGNVVRIPLFLFLSFIFLFSLYQIFSPQYADMSGQAASYYNEGYAQPQPNYDNGSYQPNQQYQQPNTKPAPYPQPTYQEPNYQPSNYQQPTFQQPTAEPKPGPQYQQTVPDAGFSFDEAFKIEKPKWNDLWAGLLVSGVTILIIF